LTLPNACSFTTPVKPSRGGQAKQFFAGDWKLVDHYLADGPDGYSWAWQNAETVCFVSEQWDDLGDDATAEQVKAWKPKPGTLAVGCTDRALFDQGEKERGGESFRQ
jgi:hypothetical protein